MIHIDVTLGDVRIIAEPGERNDWLVRLIDGLTGEEKKILIDNPVMGSLMYLAVAGDDGGGNDKLITALYATLSDEVNSLPSNLRPIPN